MSYTATRHFSLLGIPVFPTGKKRVLTQCPHCDAAMILPIHKWMQMQDIELPNRLQQWRSGSRDLDSTRSFLQFALYLEEPSFFHEVASTARINFSDDLTLIREIAEGYETLEMVKEAVATYLQASEISVKDRNTLLQESQACLERRLKPLNPMEVGPVKQLPLLVFPILLILLIAGISFYNSTWPISHVYAVNGLDEDYEISFNGTTLNLPAWGRVQMPSRPGTVTVQTVSSKFQFSPIQVRLKRSLFHPFVSDQVYVFNPDQSAVILYERIPHFKDNYQAPEEATTTLFIGENNYQLPLSDYVFEKPLETIQSQTKAKVSFREVLSVLNEVNPEDLAEWMTQEGYQKQAQTLLRAWLEAKPHRADLIYMLASMQEDQESQLQWIRSQIKNYPLRVESHCAYQDLFRSHGTNDALIKEYDAWLREYPQSSSMHYLRARLCDSPKEFRNRLDVALNLNPDCSYSHYGIARDHLMHGQFRDSEHHIKKALELNPSHEVFRTVYLELCVQSENWDTISAFVQEQHGQYPRNFEAAMTLFQAWIMLGKDNLARDVAHKFQAYNARSPQEVRSYIRNAFELQTAEAKQDKNALIPVLESVNRPVDHIQAQLLRGNLKDALEVWKSIPEPSPSELLMLLLIDAVARSHGNLSIITECTILTRTSLNTEQFQKEKIAFLLQSKGAPTLDDVMSLPFGPAEMRVVLCFFAKRYPNQKSVFLPIANRLNYNRDATRLIIGDIL